MPLLILLFVAGSPVFSSPPEEWPHLKGDHFSVYTEDGDLSYARTFLHHAERFFEKITSTLGYFDSNSWLWENRCLIHIYRDRDSYLKGSGRPAWSGASSSHYPKKMIFTYRDSPTLLEGDLPHEITHLVFRDYMGLTNPNLPLWLEEGLAIWNEEGKRVVQFNEILENFSSLKNTIPLTQLAIAISGDPHDGRQPSNQTVALYYVESYSVVKYLLEIQGRPRFADFLRSIRSRDTLQDALGKNYGHAFQDLVTLEVKWREYLKTLRPVAA